MYIEKPPQASTKTPKNTGRITKNRVSQIQKSFSLEKRDITHNKMNKSDFFGKSSSDSRMKLNEKSQEKLFSNEKSHSFSRANTQENFLYEKSLEKSFSNEKSNVLKEEKIDYYEKSSEEKSLEKPNNFKKSQEKEFSDEKSSEIIEKKPILTENLQEYIQEQEAYLEKLESERRKLKEKTKSSLEKPPFDFIQNLHEKENSFTNSNEFSQEKAQKLLEKFLGNQEFDTQQNKNVKSPTNFPLNLKATPQKSETAYKESDLSYSISHCNDFSQQKERLFDEKDWVFQSKERSDFEISNNTKFFEESAQKTGNEKEFLKKPIEYYEEEKENPIKSKESYQYYQKSDEKIKKNEVKNVSFNPKKENEMRELEENFDESQGNYSLAELFRKKKAKMLNRMEENKEKLLESQKNEDFKSRTKEELLKLRKEMMKKPSILKKPQEKNEETDKKQESICEKRTDSFTKDKNQTNAPADLMERLALGIKAKVKILKNSYIECVFLGRQKRNESFDDKKL